MLLLSYSGHKSHPDTEWEQISEVVTIEWTSCAKQSYRSTREILFNVILAEKRPERIIIIDALDCNREPGEVFTVSIEDIPERKIHDFSVHQMPTLNMLKELRDLCHVEVVVLAAQPESIPKTIQSGLSKKLQDAVPKVGRYIVKNYFLVQCTNGI